MNVVIIEDEPSEAQRLKNELDLWRREHKFEMAIAEYGSGEGFFGQYAPEALDAVSVFFLDIQLGGMSGLEVAKQLRKNGYRGPMIFLTAFREYVFHGYQVHALNYLLKPVQREPLFLCLDEIAAGLMGSTYLYRDKQEVVRIPYKDILTFSSSLHYVDILTVSGNYCQYATLGSIIEHLPVEFIRTHRSHIVNMAHIYKISGNVITLSNHMTVPVSRAYVNGVVTAFSNYSTRFDR